MRILRIVFATVITVLFFSSCQKEITDVLSTAPPTAPTPPTQSSSRPKTYSENITSSAGHDSITFNLSYDASGRLISMISASSTGDKFVYQYSASSLTLDLYNSNVVDIHEIFYLNANSFVDSTFAYNSTHDTSTEKYLYNAGNQLVSLKEFEYSTTGGASLYNTTNYTYDAAGNMIKEMDNFDVNTYTYTTLINSLSVGFDILPRAKYLVKTTTNVSGGSTITFIHTYTFDSSNRLTSEKMVGSDGEILIKSYTY